MSSTNSFVIHCPTCKRQLAVNAAHAGQLMQCPACSTQFHVPALNGVASTGAGVISGTNVLPHQAPATPTWYVIMTDGYQIGPLSESRLREMVQQRKITPQCQLWQPNWPARKSASEVFPELALPVISTTKARSTGTKTTKATPATRRKHRSIAFILSIIGIGGPVILATYGMYRELPTKAIFNATLVGILFYMIGLLGYCWGLMRWNFVKRLKPLSENATSWYRMICGMVLMVVALGANIKMILDPPAQIRNSTLTTARMSTEAQAGQEVVPASSQTAAVASTTATALSPLASAAPKEIELGDEVTLAQGFHWRLVKGCKMVGSFEPTLREPRWTFHFEQAPGVLAIVANIRKPNDSEWRRLDQELIDNVKKSSPDAKVRFVNVNGIKHFRMEHSKGMSDMTHYGDLQIDFTCTSLGEFDEEKRRVFEAMLNTLRRD